METQINPFNELAKSLHREMANTMSIIREVPGFDPATFQGMHDRYLRLVSEASALLAETVAFREYVSAYRSHLQAFEALEATEAQMHDAHQRFLRVLRGEPLQAPANVAEFPAPESATGAA